MTNKIQIYILINCVCKSFVRCSNTHLNLTIYTQMCVEQWILMMHSPNTTMESFSNTEMFLIEKIIYIIMFCNSCHQTFPVTSDKTLTTIILSQYQILSIFIVDISISLWICNASFWCYIPSPLTLVWYPPVLAMLFLWDTPIPT